MVLVRLVGMGVLAAALAAACGQSKDDGVAAQTGGTAGTDSGGTGGTGSGGTAGTGQPSGDPVSDFRAAEYAAICHALFSCTPRNDDDVADQAVFGSEARCVAIIGAARSPSIDVPDLVASVAAGTVKFHPEKAAACTAALAKCGILRMLVEPDTRECRAVFEGTTALGGACRRNEECAGDALCRGEAACPGTCVARAAPGAPCEDTGDCDDSSGTVVCDYGDTGGGVCRAITVRAPAAEGGACRRSVSDALDFTPCQAGLWCESTGTALGDGICRKPLARGTACSDADTICEFGSFCFDEVSCKPWNLVQAAGGACVDEIGPYCDPTRRLSCVDGKCAAVGDGKLGSACSGGDYFDLATCDSGLVCYPTRDANGEIVSEHCDAPHAAGDPCNTGSHCASGSCQTDGTCAPLYCDLDQ